MKSILFVSSGLGIGGIEKCLVNFINNIPPETYDIDLLLTNPYYELKKDIKRPINILNTFEYVSNADDNLNYLRSMKRVSLLKIYRYLSFRMLLKIKYKPWIVFKKIKKEYDYAIAYSQNDLSIYYVMDKITAKKKYMWYHNGIYDKGDRAKKLDKKYYSSFDKIITVSSDAAEMLSRTFDFKDNQLMVLPNFYDNTSILNNSKMFSPFTKTEGLILVTVGRLTKEKGFDLLIQAAKNLKLKGYIFCWYWVGATKEARKKAINLLVKLGLSDCVQIIPLTSNPYPYIKNCDIYIQPSHYEAYCTTIVESKILGKLIIATDVGGVKDQIIDGETGLISSVNADSLTIAIIELLENARLRRIIEQNILKENMESRIQFEKYEKRLFS